MRAYAAGLLAGYLVLVPLPAASQSRGDTARGMPDTTRILRLEPLSVVGTRPGDLRLLPGSASIVSRDELQRHRPEGAHQLIRREPGLHVMDEDPLGLNLNIGVRGMNPRRSSRVLLLEDGIPIQLGPYADPSAHYQPPADVLERVEIVKGSGQIMHGPQTVGGVINFVRAAPAGREILASVSAGQRGQQSILVRTGTAIGDHAVSASYNRRRADGVRRSTTHALEDIALQGSLKLAGGTLHLRAAHYIEDSGFGESGLTQAEFETDPFMNPTPDDIFDLSRTAVAASFSRDHGRAGAFALRMYAQRTDRASWRQASSSEDRFGGEDYASDFACPPTAVQEADCGFQGRPRTYGFAGIEPRLRIVTVAGALDAGLRLHHETAHRRQYIGVRPGERDAERVRDNMLRTTAWSAFGQLRIVRGAFSLTPGARVEHVRAANENRMQPHTLRDTYTQLLPGVGLSYDMRTMTWFAGAHRGFAPPRPADILTAEPGGSLVQVDPELSWSYELGARARPLAWLGLEATLFRTDFTNQVVEAGAAAGQRFVNAGATLHRGLELHADIGALSGRVRPSLEVAYTLLADARFEEHQVSSVDEETNVRGRRLPYAPRHLLRVTTGLDLGTQTALRVRTDHTSAQFADDLNTVEPSPDGMRGLLTARTIIGATVTQTFARLTVFARMDNITNRLYITDRLEGIFTGMPRRFAAGIEYRQ